MAASNPLEPEEPIAVQVDETFTGEVDAADLARAIGLAFHTEARDDAQATLVITGDEEVHALNRQYLGEDRPTDVLSFPTSGPLPEDQGIAGNFVAAPEASSYLGDIVIALPYARRQAAVLGRTLRDELRLLAVHGALHLLGYDHAEPDEEARMWARQDAILAQLD